MRWQQPFVFGVTLVLFATTVTANGPARGDFDGDGFDDLAVGVSGESIDLVDSAGAVHVIYGTPVGLRAPGNQFWHQDSPGVKDECEEDDQFGFALAVGDFDGDGFDDLAIGVLGEEVDGVVGGAVNVLYGSAAGLTANNDQFWSQNSSQIKDVVEVQDAFGYALHTGDFDGDGFDDLAIGVIGEVIDGDESAGAVNVLYGSPQGLRAEGNQFFSIDSSGMIGTPGEQNFFGYTLAVGDFDNDGFDDLAIAVIGEPIKGLDNAGAVKVLYGTANGLRTNGLQSWSQDSPQIKDQSDADEFFGYGMAAGDFNGDGFDDLAIGAYGEIVNTFTNAGAVNVLYGTSLGLRSTGNQFFTQETQGINNIAATDDYFGYTLAVGDFDGDGFDDLAVDIVGETINGFDDAGAVTVLFGAASGLQTAGDQFWSQHSPGIQGNPEAEDFLGESLMVGDYNGDGFDDLGIGVLRDTIGLFDNAGAVNVINGSSNGLTSVGSHLWSQESQNILDDAEADDNFGGGWGI